MPEAFKALHNYYIGHTYTDIGNNLLNTYERYFLPYEKSHPEDVNESPCTHCQKTHNERWGWGRGGRDGVGRDPTGAMLFHRFLGFQRRAHFSGLRV